jgi:hypothetical protein
MVYKSQYSSLNPSLPVFKFQKSITLDLGVSHQAQSNSLVDQVMRLFDDEDSSKKTHFWENFRFEWKDCKHFIVGLAYHTSPVTPDSLKQAYSFYKKAIRRTESPLPCFNLMLSLQLAKARALPPHE